MFIRRLFVREARREYSLREYVMKMSAGWNVDSGPTAAV